MTKTKTTLQYLKAAGVGRLLDRVHQHKVNYPNATLKTMDRLGVASYFYGRLYYDVKQGCDTNDEILAEIQRQYPHKVEVIV